MWKPGQSFRQLLLNVEAFGRQFKWWLGQNPGDPLTSKPMRPNTNRVRSHRQYDSLVRRLQRWLESHGAIMVGDCEVTAVFQWGIEKMTRPVACVLMPFVN